MFFLLDLSIQAAIKFFILRKPSRIVRSGILFVLTWQESSRCLQLPVLRLYFHMCTAQCCTRHTFQYTSTRAHYFVIFCFFLLYNVESYIEHMQTKSQTVRMKWKKKSDAGENMILSERKR